MLTIGASLCERSQDDRQANEKVHTLRTVMCPRAVDAFSECVAQNSRGLKVTTDY